MPILLRQLLFPEDRFTRQSVRPSENPNQICWQIGIVSPENVNTPYDNRKGVKRLNKEKEVEAYLNGELTEEQRLKYEIAGELGVLDKVLENGWKSLSAKETGRIGGLMTRRKRHENIDE